jgi:hypothetical protein
VAEEWPIVETMRLIEVPVDIIENCVKYNGDQSHPKIEIGIERMNERPSISSGIMVWASIYSSMRRSLAYFIDWIRRLKK